ncbi:high nitrogen upregulated cytochrome P450 monooxygenase 2 [Mycena sanguinolenta]|nr:high nitrogen upregulated cytochrome P450 monooxygenase 2 [Mycena sanguinolenta]
MPFPFIWAAVLGLPCCCYSRSRFRVYTYVVFLGSLTLSIIVYRLSHFHPLAQYPGPAIAKVTKLWSFWKTTQGYKYLWHKELHDKYGPFVRTGPNEISVIDAPAVCQILNFGGSRRDGVNYESARHKDTPPAIVCLSGEARTAKRRPSSVDLVHWLDLFAYESLSFPLVSALTNRRYDLMGDLAFGGGFEMLRDERDLDGVGERIRGYTKYDGSLADESDLEKEKPTLKTSAVDRVVAVVAASDTTTPALSSTVWFLLSNLDYYRRVQQEADTVNEALRLHPPLPSNGPRQVHLNQPGRTIAGRFIPEGTSVYTPAYSLHRNPEYFSPHPDKFLPERWLPDSKFEKHDTSAFIPFSLGPANCVGQKFAKREMLMVLSALFKTFDMRFAGGFDSEAWPVGMQDFLSSRADLYS